MAQETRKKKRSRGSEYANTKIWGEKVSSSRIEWYI